MLTGNSILSIWLFGAVLNNFFGRASQAKSIEKFLFWLGMLAGVESIASIFLLASNPAKYGEFSFMAANGILVDVALITSLLAILAGHIYFAVYSIFVAQLFTKTLSLIIVMPCATFAFPALYLEVEMSGDINLPTHLALYGGLIFALMMVLLLIEVLCQIVFFTVRRTI